MSGELKFTFDQRVFERRMGILSTKVIPYMRVTWAQIAQFALDTVRAYSPITSPGRTKIRDLWRMKHSKSAAAEIFFIENTYRPKKVLTFFEEGTKAHQIRPRTARVLHFFLDTGEEIFTRLVRHPGTIAWHMVEQTERETNIKLNHYITSTMKMVDDMMRVGGA